MKKLLLSAVFAAALATPALAQSYSADYGSGNVINEPHAERNGSNFTAGHDAVAYAPPHHARHTRSVRAPVSEQNQPVQNADENY